MNPSDPATSTGASIADALMTSLPEEGDILVQTAFGELEVPAEDKSSDELIINEEFYEPQETAIVSSLLTEGCVMIDVGANIGYFTLLAAEQCGNSGSVLAFEPDSRNREYLLKNVLNGSHENVEIHSEAVSSTEGSRPLYISGTNYGRHSFAAANVPNRVARAFVSTTTLDVAAKDISLSCELVIKMDVEGAEGDVLRGAKETLSRPAVSVWLELWPAGLESNGTDALELLEWLELFDFHVAAYDDVALIPMSLSTVREMVRNKQREIFYLLLTRSRATLERACHAAQQAPPMEVHSPRLNTDSLSTD